MFPFGVTYYPDQWPKDTWDKTFKEIRQAGFNIIRFGEMAWDWIEPAMGKFDFSGLDRAMDLCQKNNLKVLLGIPTSQVPSWFHIKFPNSRPVAQDGTLYPEYGPRPNICKDNVNYQKLATQLATKIVNRYQNHPALLMWQLDNEPVYPPLDHTTSNDFCHCEMSRKAFINWAKKRYGKISKLNEVWGSKFWTTTFGGFDEIQTPKGGLWEAVSPHIFLDWYRFKSESIKNWVEHLAETVRKIDKKHKVGTNGFIGIVSRVPDHSIIPEKLDWYGLDIYPKGGRMDERGLSMSYDLWRSFTRGTKAEFHITELQGGQNVRWGAPEYVGGPEIKDWTELALKHGAQAILYHAWRPPLFGAETGGFGILRSDGTATNRLQTIKKLSKKIRNLKSEIRNKSQIRNSKIAIAYLRSSETQSYQEQGPPRGIAGQWEAVRSDIGLLHGIESINGAHLAVYKKEQPVDFIFERDLDIGKLPYKTILMPNPYLISKRQYQNLKNWISAGGTLITEARFGLKDENGRLYEKPLMEDLIKFVYDHTEINEDGFLDVLEGLPNKYQIIKRKTGKGTVVYANFSLFLIIMKGKSKWQNTDSLIKKIKSML